MNIHQRIAATNPHWQPGSALTAEIYHRDLFSRLWQDRQQHLMSLIIGPRRTGKSVILRQILKDLVEVDKIPPTQILFFEFTPGDSADTVWDVWQFLALEIAQPGSPTFLFFDEIQFVKDHELTLKLIYDTSPQTKIFLTGSLSLTYKRRMSESLAGRFLPYPLFPLKFSEYLQLTHSPAYRLYNQILPETNPPIKTVALRGLNPVFRTFLRIGRLPELARLPDPANQSSYLDTILNQSLSQDAFSYFQIEKPPVLTSIFNSIRQNPGGLINIDSLSRALATSRETVTKYLDVLEIMRLVYFVYNSISPLPRLNLTRKAYTSSHFALPKYDLATSTGFLAESYVLERLLEQGKPVTFFRSRGKEIDFLTPDEKMAYEVKFTGDPGKLTTLKSFAIGHNYTPRVISLDQSQIDGVSATPTCLF